MTGHEWRGRQGDLVELVTLTEFEEGLADDSALNGCSPFACSTGDPVDDLDDADHLTDAATSAAPALKEAT